MREYQQVTTGYTNRFNIKKNKMSNIKLINGECLEEMAKLPDGSFDMILTDPPYGNTNCRWDSVIPLEPMWEQLKRLIKPNGAIVLFGSEPFSSTLRISNLTDYKYDWIWIKRPIRSLRRVRGLNTMSPLERVPE